MHPNPGHHDTPPLQGADSINRLKEEIAFLEARLDEMGQSGDCAYEKALVRSYNERLAARRDELAALGTGH